MFLQGNYTESTNNYSTQSGPPQESAGTSLPNGGNALMTAKEEENWRKNRRKRDSHNISKNCTTIRITTISVTICGNYFIRKILLHNI
jgi:hypothetical protein